MRRLLEHVTRNLAFRRRLPAAFNYAPIYISPSAGLSFLCRSVERIDGPLLRAAADLVRPENTVWDIGANVGLFTYAAAARGGPSGKVFAIEPDTWLAGLLRRSARIQPSGSAQVTVIPAAVGAEVGIAAFHISRRSRSSNALEGYGQSQMGGTAEIQTVVTLSLDWLSERLPAPDVVKVDVEGAEGEVFGQSVGFLKRYRPVVVCEVSDRARATIAQVFGSADYLFFDGEQPLRESSPLPEPPWATIAIPREKEMLFRSKSVETGR